jgi:hypothetical protein
VAEEGSGVGVRGGEGCCGPAVRWGGTAKVEVGYMLRVEEEGSGIGGREDCCCPAVGWDRTA